ncbi:MAG: Hsp20/alpha crystallin family protein, partial [Flavitalea sp.]
MTTNMLSRTSNQPSVFDDFFKPWNDLFTNGGALNKIMTVPAVNVKDNENEYQLTLGVPGMKKEDFYIKVEKNLITISAEKEENKEEKNEKYSKEEYNYSSFTRTFSIPEDAKHENIQAKYDNGVLMISIPKKEEAKKMTT